MKQRVAIIGAGIGGLATANLLADAGYQVDVYEKATGPGGRAGRLEKDGFSFDTGPSWYLMPSVFSHYYDLLGKNVDNELDLVRLSPAYQVFFERQPSVVITSDLTADAATFEGIETGAGESLKTYVRRAQTIYDLSLKHFLYSNFVSIGDFLKKDVISNGLTMLRLALTPIDRYVSQFVHDKRLKQILEYQMVFLGTSPFKAPAIYSLMSALDFNEGVYYPRGGIYEIITSLVSIGKANGVNYHFNAEVTEITVSNGKATGLTLQDHDEIVADIIISDADLHFTETQLLPKEHQSYPDSYWKSKEASPSALLLYLGIEGTIPEFQHHNLLFVDDWKTNFADIYDNKKAPEKASIYICKPSETDASVAPKGQENIFVLVPLPADVAMDEETISLLRNRYIKQIETMTGVKLNDRIISETRFGPDDFKTQYYSWQSSMLGQSHKLRQSAFFRTPNTSKKLDNLYYVGANTMPGIGLPMCLIGAELVYKRLAGDISGGPVSEIRTIGERE